MHIHLEYNWINLKELLIIAPTFRIRPKYKDASKS